MSFAKCVKGRDGKGDYVYAAISVKANQWAFDRNLHYIFKIGRASASYDRLRKLNEGWVSQGTRKPPLLHCTDWQAIDCWPTDGKSSSEDIEKNLRKSLRRYFDEFPWKLKCPEDREPNGATEVYRLAQKDFDDALLDILSKANDPTGEQIMHAVARRIRGLVEQKILPSLTAAANQISIAG